MLVLSVLYLLLGTVVGFLGPRLSYRLQRNFEGKSSSSSFRTGTRAPVLLASRVDNILEWTAAQPLHEVAPRASVETVLLEVRSAEFWSAQYANYSALVDKVEASLRQEKRSIKDVLGVNTTLRILEIVEKADVLDPQSVNSFLKQTAFEELVGSVLYDAIFTFIESVDLLGNAINQLPIIGPMRMQINNALRKSLDLTLGRQIKSFLGQYNRVAIQKVVDYALSKENRSKFAGANKALVASLLSRPVSSYIPSIEDVGKLKLQAWTALVEGLGQNETASILDQLYKAFGDDKISDFVSVDALLDVSPTLRELLERNLNSLIASEQGRALIASL